MTGPEKLKRNLTILRMYDSGEYTKKEIWREMNLTSVDVVTYVIRTRALYETDPRRYQVFHTEQSSRKLKNPPLSNFKSTD